MKQSVEFLHRKWDTVEKCCPDFGSNGELEFPCGEIIDQVTVDENLIGFVRKLLATDQITLIQSDAWSKAGKELTSETDAAPTEDSKDSKALMSGAYSEQKGAKLNNQDQRVHMDYGNNTFLHPSDWKSPETVAAIVYFHDTSKSGGGTAVAPRKGDNDELYKPPFINMPGYGQFKFINNKTAAEEYFRESYPDVAEYRQKLYDREIIGNFKQGDVLFYRMDTWHRGTPVNEGKIRTIMSLAWRKTDCFWYNTWNPGFSKKMYYGVIEKLIKEMSPSQRGTIGIPLPGHSYWTHHSIQMFKERYPGIDVTPYTNMIKN